MKAEVKIPKSADRFVHVFKRKPDDNIEAISDQDKKHMRVIAILQMAKEGTIPLIMNSEFTEKFYFDKEHQTAIYEIRIKKERKKDKYADC